MQSSCEWLVNYILQRKKSKVSLWGRVVTVTQDHIYRIPKGRVILFFISTLPLPLLTRPFEGAMKVSLVQFISSVRDKLDLSLSLLGKGRGGAHLK